MNLFYFINHWLQDISKVIATMMFTIGLTCLALATPAIGAAKPATAIVADQASPVNQLPKSKQLVRGRRII